MSLSDREREVIAAAGTAPLQTARGQAVAIVLSKQGSDREIARALLAESYLAATQPSFHLIPRGDAMASEADFDAVYDILAEETGAFTNVSPATLAAALDREPAALAPLRMILGFTTNELAVAIRLLDPGQRAAGASLKNFERRLRPAGAATSARSKLIAAIAQTAMALMARTLLPVPTPSEEVFHSKLDKRDTRDGWQSVASDACGVPYPALLHQRYVGGVWLVAQAAYSEAKGDALLEHPVAALLESEQVSFYRSRTGASGAVETAQMFGPQAGPGLSPAGALAHGRNRDEGRRGWRYRARQGCSTRASSRGGHGAWSRHVCRNRRKGLSGTSECTSGRCHCYRRPDVQPCDARTAAQRARDCGASGHVMRMPGTD